MNRSGVQHVAVALAMVMSFVAGRAFGQPLPDEGRRNISGITLLAAEGGVLLDKNPTVQVGAHLQLTVMAVGAGPVATIVTDKARLTVNHPEIGAVDDKAIFTAEKPGAVTVTAAVSVHRHGGVDNVIDPAQPGLFVEPLASFTAQMTVTVAKSDARPNPKPAPAALSEEVNAAELGQCKITVLKSYFWRDWMPIVEEPGPDGGSPLRLTVTLKLENPAKEAARLSCTGVAINAKGEARALTLHIQPNFRVLPDEISKSYPDMDAESKKKVIDKYRVLWDGALEPGESRELILGVNNGPYWPAHSIMHVELTWMDQNDHAVIVKTPPAEIDRTD
jgi:hypothetical protein